ncbi:MAG: acetyl-CoA carboxylase biotin carboxyl carrier protein subunit [Dehalococcoidia bacterium]|jgi:biotin carboxyl carrier protein|nr:acetyl-CoA carboxylase biotin carboxyl carrier protein subunit [Dehalococcoidia bacterium]
MDVNAEWPGKIAEVVVAVGDAVEAEQELLTLESMKMLTPVASPAAGTVSEILIELEQYVEEGQTLLRLDG